MTPLAFQTTDSLVDLTYIARTNGWDEVVADTTSVMEARWAVREARQRAERERQDWLRGGD